MTTSQKATRRAYRLRCCYDESLYLLLYIEALNMDELLLVGKTNTKIDPFARIGSYDVHRRTVIPIIFALRSKLRERDHSR